jgi:uracil-DNA glycosylase
MSDEISDELTACMERLRWIFAGYRAGGVRDWHYKPRKATEDVAPEGAPNGTSTVSEISEALAGCKRCRLHSGRTNLVFGEGSTRSGLVFVGEGPGFDEDRQARPFVGRAGKLLDKMIAAIGFEREEVYICNVVKCRPPENRTPQPDEIAACSPFLFRQIEALAPRVICALGACATQTLLGNTLPISQARGRIHLWRGIPLICTFHPAYLLRNAAQKAATWLDLKEVLKVLGSKTSD